METAFFNAGVNSEATAALAARINRGLYAKIIAADIIDDPKTWPLVWIRLLFTAHKDRRERYRLFVFLWKNGVPPLIARQWVMYHGIVNHAKFGYDRSAWSSLEDAVKDTQTAEGRAKLSLNRVIDLQTGKVD